MTSHTPTPPDVLALRVAAVHAVLAVRPDIAAMSEPYLAAGELIWPIGFHGEGGYISDSEWDEIAEAIG